MEWFLSWAKEKSLTKTQNVWISNPEPKLEFTEKYIQLRDKEKRIATDEELAKLPYTNKNHLHSEEWKIRSRSLNKYQDWLNTKNKKQTILEIGAGNGWFSANLSKQGHKVIAQDINLAELKQAANVFDDKNIYFLCAEIMDIEFPNEVFDQIVFASSIQYFEDINFVLQRLNKNLKSEGEIHIIDSPLYNSFEKASEAKERSRNYYKSSGFEELANNYHHHLMENFKNLKINFHQKPDNSIFKRIFNLSNPFYWISIKKY